MDKHYPLNLARLLPLVAVCAVLSDARVFGDEKTAPVDDFAEASIRPADVTFEPARQTRVFKKTPQGELSLHIFYPQDWNASDRRTAIVFFFGGGWVGGSPSQFFPQCTWFASRGAVAISAEYRVKNRHGTSPFECVADGKSAIRHVWSNAQALGIDPKRIVAAGGSAGGHVAACTATILDQDEADEDLAVSSRPNALVLFNPVCDTSPEGFGNRTLDERWLALSPAHHITKDTPPTIIFHGTADTTVPFDNVKGFTERMHVAGRTCTLVPFAGKKHGFFNHGRDKDNESYNETVLRADQFLVSLGFLQR